MLSRKSGLLVALFLTFASTLHAAERMPLSDVQKGMKGYGLTVFEGTKIEKFDVEILGVLKNVGPGQNLILAKVDSPVIRRANVIAGMSGSPIFIDGKVIGALAYAWQFQKEPVAGITPIEEMLKIAQVARPAGASPAGAVPRMTGVEMLSAIANRKPEEGFDKLVKSMAATPMNSISGATRIALPVSVGSFAPETIQRFAPYFEQLGVVTVPAGAASSSATPELAAKKSFEPGDPVGAVLLTGDFNVAATGTVTYVDDEHVYAFGHPFLDMGEINFPMATSEVVGVLPSVASSFKFSNTGPIVGVLRQDRAAGIMGVLGAKADMIPVDVTMNGAGPASTYHVDVVRHSYLSPLMLAMVTDSIVSNAQRAAGERTVLMEGEIDIKGFPPVKLREGFAGQQARQAIPQYLALVSGYLMSNEFRDAEIESVKIHLRHDDDLRIAKLMEASLVKPGKRVSPGDTVQVRTVLKPFRGEAFVETFDVRIPDDQPAGASYLLVGSGSVMNAIDFSLVPPDPRTLEQVVSVLERLRPATDLTVGLYSTSEGAVTSGVYLPNLPPSMRAVVVADTSNGAQAAVKYHPAGQTARSLGYIVDGALKIDLDVQPAF